MRVAISYVRFSTERQGLGDSLRRQVERTRAYCERHGLHLDDSLRLADLGVSAFRGKNATKGKLAAFLEAAESGRVPKGSVLVVESLDRLSRQSLDYALQLFMRIVQAGIDIVTLDPERVHTRESIKNLTGLIEPIVIMSRSNEESESKSSRVGEVWVQRRQSARQGKPVGGTRLYWIDYQGGKFVERPERVALVRRVFELAAKGYGMPSICAQLNADPTAPKPTAARAWRKTSIHAILTNRAVLGEYQPHKLVEGARVPEGDPIPDYYPPIIDPALFHRVQASLKSRTPGRTSNDEHVNCFKGKLICGLDGLPMYVFSTNNRYKGKKYVYYNIQSSGVANNVPGACRARLKYDTFEKAFLTYVHALKPSDFTRDGSNLADETGEVTGQLAETEHKIRFTRERIKGKPLKDVEHLFGLLDELEVERKALAERLDALKAQASNQDGDSVGELRSLADMLDAADPDAARDLRVQIRQRIDQLVDSIVLYPVVHSARGSKVAYDCLVVVRFRDASQRWYVTDDTGALKIGNLLLPQQGAEFDEFLRRLNQDVQVVFPS